jgi:hypothetical protein
VCLLFDIPLPLSFVRNHTRTCSENGEQVTITDYRKALGDAEGVGELMVFYCERAAGFSRDVSHDDAGYFDAVVRMFEQAHKTVNTLPEGIQRNLIARLERVRNMSGEPGYDGADNMDVLLSEFVPGVQREVRDSTRSKS